MNRFKKGIFSGLFVSLMALMLTTPFNGIAQTSPTPGARVGGTEDESILRALPVCEEKQQLLKRYATYEADELVKELTRKDTMFICSGARGTIYTLSRRLVIQLLISQNRNEALPYLIKVVENEKPQLRVLALELMQDADDQLLRPHRTLFLEKSQSKHHGERNRSLYILQRIKDKHIEEVIVKRWNSISTKELKKLSGSSSLRIWFELMLYNVKDRALLEKSIISTLREKTLEPDVLSEYIRAVRSFVSKGHDIQIDEEVIEMLMKTEDQTVADYATAVLSDSRTIVARDGLVRALELRNDSIRAIVAEHLISRSDFDILEQKSLLERMLADSSRMVIQHVFSALTWKKPGASESAVVIQSLLKHLSESDKPKPQKVIVLMYFYPSLDKAMRDSICLSDPTLVLKSIELAFSSPEYGRFSREVTERIFEQIHGKKEMDISYLEFWSKQLKH
jgi:HEAT repeat protein